MFDLYEYHLWFLGAWIFASLIQASLEVLAWKTPAYAQNVAAMNYKLNIFLGYPSMLGMCLCFIFLYSSKNLQFPTSIIFMFSQGLVTYFGLFGAFLIHRRKEENTAGVEEAEKGYIKRIRFFFLISIPAALLTAAAELHIMTNWITNLFS